MHHFLDLTVFRIYHRTICNPIFFNKFFKFKKNRQKNDHFLWCFYRSSCDFFDFGAGGASFRPLVCYHSVCTSVHTCAQNDIKPAHFFSAFLPYDKRCHFCAFFFGPKMAKMCRPLYSSAHFWCFLQNTGCWKHAFLCTLRARVYTGLLRGGAKWHLCAQMCTLICTSLHAPKSRSKEFKNGVFFGFSVCTTIFNSKVRFFNFSN